LKVGSFSVLIRGTKSDALIYAVGRQANGDQLNLEAAGVTVGSRGRLKVNEYFQTEVPHIYAAGDVIGFPALASTSMEQGRLTASHMFGLLFGHQSRGVSRRVGFSDGSHNCCTLEDVFPFAFEVQICDLCQSCRATITQTRRSFAVL
jgi:NADH dehydrogenase FAD-containing subunit